MIRPEFTVVRQSQTFVLNKGLLDLAHEQGLKAIRAHLVQIPGDDNGDRTDAFGLPPSPVGRGMPFLPIRWLGDDVLRLDPANMSGQIADPEPVVTVSLGLAAKQHEGGVIRQEEPVIAV
jgi:hypothetical protein